MVEIKSKKPKRKLTRKEAIKKGNKEFKNFTRELAKSMNASGFKEIGKNKK